MNFDKLFVDNREDGKTILEQSQYVMSRMLKILDYLCMQHNIKYFLVGGSLLGAVRHQGFIPWDDDLDIGMTRKNYEKFVECAVPELPADIFFQCHETDSYYPPNSRVEGRLRDKYSNYKHNKKNNDWHEGLQVDIFVYDKAFLPHNFFIILQNSILKRLKSNRKRAQVLKWISKYVPFPFVYASNYLESFRMLKLGANFIKGTELSSLERRNFETIEVLVPQGWDNCLRRQYGNYMELPPVEKRIGHRSVTPDPFTPCNHKEILHWKDRNRSPFTQK